MGSLLKSCKGFGKVPSSFCTLGPQPAERGGHVPESGGRVLPPTALSPVAEGTQSRLGGFAVKARKSIGRKLNFTEHLL